MSLSFIISLFSFCLDDSFIISLFSFCLDDLCIGDSDALIFPTANMFSLMWVLSLSILFYFLTNVSAFYLGNRHLELTCHLGGFFSLMSMKCPSSSLLLNFG